MTLLQQEHALAPLPLFSKTNEVRQIVASSSDIDDKIECDEPLASEPEVGDVVLGSFKLLKRIGSGAFATAYLAHQQGTDRKAVVKIPHRHLLNGESGDSIRARFAAELRASSRINHPNIATVYTAGDTHGSIPTIAMEYVAGYSLRKVLKTRAPAHGALGGQAGLSNGLGAGGHPCRGDHSPRRHSGQHHRQLDPAAKRALCAPGFRGRAAERSAVADHRAPRHAALHAPRADSRAHRARVGHIRAGRHPVVGGYRPRVPRRDRRCARSAPAPGPALQDRRSAHHPAVSGRPGGRGHRPAHGLRRRQPAVGARVHEHLARCDAAVGEDVEARAGPGPVGDRDRDFDGDRCREPASEPAGRG